MKFHSFSKAFAITSLFIVTDPGMAAQGDIDNDGISDTYDNCPSVANQEQFDDDDDGLGNDCDATLFQAGDIEQDYVELKVLPVGGIRHTLVGVVRNHTNAPVAWSADSASSVMDVDPAGTVQPGGMMPIYAHFDPAQLQPGTRSRHRIQTWFENRLEEIDFYVTVEGRRPDYCGYEVSLYRVDVVEDQTSVGDGFFGEALEVEAYDEIGGDSTNWPRSGRGHDLYEGEHSTPDQMFHTGTVTEGSSVSLSLYSKATDNDSGLNGADDWGDKNSTITFTCIGSGSTDKAATISLTHNGNGTGKIKVTTRTRWNDAL